MIDLILVNEDACIFGNEVSIQSDVSRGTEGEKTRVKFEQQCNCKDECTVNRTTVLSYQ